MDRLYIPVIILHLSILARNILLQRSLNYGVWNYWHKKFLCCICYTIWIDWHMNFRLEQEGGSLIAQVALAHPLDPIDNRSRNRRRNMWVGWCVSSWWPLFPSNSSVSIYIYICIFYMSPVYDVYIHTTGVSFSIGEAAPHHILWDCVSGECAVPGLNAAFCFLWFTNCFLLSDDNSLIPGCLRLLTFILTHWGRVTYIRR